MVISFTNIFSKSRVITDGGLGTTLEDVFHSNISNTPLWSAKPILEQPESIVEAHLTFMKAGAEVISTSTYQCSFDAFDRSGYTRETATDVMLQSVSLAKEAREKFYAQSSERPIKIALSLGPFGASLSPAQEFNGYYPPPYGPKGYSPGESNTNYFLDDKAEAEAIQALAEFHFDRLSVFAHHAETWEIIDCIAFETVPLTREILAIRMAMGRLGSEKPWWISAVFPGGAFPEASSAGSSKLVHDVVLSALGSDLPLGDSLAVPSGLGINCTELRYVRTLVGEMLKSATEVSHMAAASPWLVVYPNGGGIYDPVTQTWQHPAQTDHNEKQGWVQELADVIRSQERSAFWGGIIVGGCCKTVPSDIAALSRTLKH
ncbi:Homocysteine S-methyltransferase [Mycena floridula]|nr:Homocysteine S-methyltransferase [Mycena floridula]